ncbi:hypothetical protein CTA2_8919 [Colletotrichum tanaceti]|nr:hypothetical protein CTA2_8919 [Colletotrichum tanaceti]
MFDCRGGDGCCAHTHASPARLLDRHPKPTGALTVPHGSASIVSQPLETGPSLKKPKEQSGGTRQVGDTNLSFVCVCDSLRAGQPANHPNEARCCPVFEIKAAPNVRLLGSTGARSGP